MKDFVVTHRFEWCPSRPHHLRCGDSMPVAELSAEWEEQEPHVGLSDIIFAAVTSHNGEIIPWETTVSSIMAGLNFCVREPFTPEIV